MPILCSSFAFLFVQLFHPSFGDSSCDTKFENDPNLLFCLPENYSKLRRPTPGYDVNITEDGRTFTVPGP